MYQDKKIGVVVPAYNEEKLIGRVIETMPDFVDRIYVVDDCSKDATCEQVAHYIPRPSMNGRLELIRHTANQGVGGAIVTGYKKAIEEGVDVVAVMAGDAQMDPNELARIISPVASGECDYVKGNRLFTGEAWQIIPRYRYLGNAFLSLLTKIASGYWHVADSQTGYTAISLKALQTLPLNKLYKRYGYPNHLLVMLNVYNFRVLDVPVQPIYNIGEKSGIRLWKVIPVLSWILLTQFLWRMKEKYIIRDFHPLIFFYALSFFLLTLVIGLAGRMFWMWASTGRIPPINALAVMFAGITGLQSLFFAMWFDMEYTRRSR
jgi:glycosyltransferase involved in cell wall biosynthesis